MCEPSAQVSAASEGDRKGAARPASDLRRAQVLVSAGAGSAEAELEAGAVFAAVEVAAADRAVRVNATAEMDKWRARFSEIAGGGINRFAAWRRFRCRTRR